MAWGRMSESQISYRLIFIFVLMDYLPEILRSITVNFKALTVTGIATLCWLVLSYYNSEARKLGHIPTVGSALPLLSLIRTFEFVKDAHTVVASGIRKWPGRIFKVPTLTGWIVVITDPKLVDEIRKAPERRLSGWKAIEDSLQTRFTLGPQIMENPFHFPIIQTRLTREIPVALPHMRDEVIEACNQYLPAKDGWSSVNALEFITTTISRASNRIFLGPILCRNSHWTKVSVEFTLHVVTTANFLRFFPAFLRPSLNYFAGRKLAQCNREGLQFLAPLIAARRNKKKEENSNDFLSWLMDEAKGEEQEDWALVARIFSLQFEAVRTTSMTLTHVLFDLAANPEYLKPLREEVEELVQREGWTKAALDQMHKVDSFVKESQRLHPVGILMQSRCAVVDYTFSDGTTVPAGTIVSVPYTCIHLDPDIYEDPLKFDGFRFIKMKERAALDGRPEAKFDMVTINADFIAFGQGRHTCPGRFFASAEIKILLGHIITNYDLKLDIDEEARPSDLVTMNRNQPNPAARVCFRRRIE